mmetsp:Transcript_18193/g.34645  ORF Transcript_18193/g.34645 Transcript_18193/m.34645 type:complete len:224 (-) Transcript_18193:337-1008(-)
MYSGEHHLVPFFRFFFLGSSSESLSELLLLSESLSLSLLELESESELDESDESELVSLSLSLSLLSLSDTCCCCCMIILGMFFKYSRRASVRPPSPMDVKKLMLKRVLRGTSLGKIPPKYSCMEGSDKRVLSSRRPMFSASSWNRILMKMREEEVVSSSVMTMFASTTHGSASVASRCAKNLAVLRSLLVSRRWIMPYCLRKDCSNSIWYSCLMKLKRWPRRP